MAGGSSGAGSPEGEARPGDSDRSVRVTVPRALAEEAGAFLMDVLGPFEEELPPVSAAPCAASEESGAATVLVFYPPADGPSTREELLAILPEEFAQPGALEVQTDSVSRDWVEGWRDHFRPIVIGRVRIRPPWEEALCGATPGSGDSGLIDVMINPGLGFGTGLHPTTRGTLQLLQEGPAPTGASAPADGAAASNSPPANRGPLVDVGTGSGILAIAATKLGWSPVTALDNDPVALASTRENVVENGVGDEVDIHEADTDTAEEAWFDDATVLANMTLEPVSLLLRRLATLAARPRRLVVSGILAGSQEDQIMLIAHEAGFTPGRRQYEGEWVSFELLPDRTAD